MHLNKLTALKVERAHLKPGMHGDGGGLYLRVAPGGSRQWMFRYRKRGKLTDMGLGGVTSLTLSDARQKAAEARKLLAEGKDPLAARQAADAAQAVARARGVTFEAVARQCIDARKSGWRNAKHAAQWLSSLETYAFPIFGAVPVADVDVTMVLRVLEPIWDTKTETASRVRQRIETVLDYARVRNLRGGDNPARWKGHLAEVLPARSKVQRVVHHPSMPYPQIPAFMARLRRQSGAAAMALEFLILTAARTGEVIGATWDEIDLKTGTWAVPGTRIKAKRLHRVPLSTRALEILRSLPHREGYLFPGQKAGKGLSSGAFDALLDRMKIDDFVTHGFRSSFRDWAAERTNYPREVAEAALAHVTGDKVEAAYRRTDLFEKRRRLMRDWANFCSTQDTARAGKVVSLQARSGGRSSSRV